MNKKARMAKKDVVLVEVYEENLFLQRYVLGKGKCFQVIVDILL